MKQRDQLKILLLQIREDETTLMEEYFEFVQFSGLKPEQITQLNTFATPSFAPTDTSQFDVLFVGGSSDASVLKPVDYPFVPDCKRLIRHCYEQDIPVFASCFGFQLAMEELGGQVIFDKANMEMGIYPIQLDKTACQTDPLLHDYPDSFWAVSGHKERASQIPDNAITLGSTELCPYHIVKFENKPFYCFQFHPEVSTEDLIARITRYQVRYLDNSDKLQEIVDAAVHDTPLSNKLVADFIDRIALPHLGGSRKN